MHHLKVLLTSRTLGRHAFCWNITSKVFKTARYKLILPPSTTRRTGSFGYRGSWRVFNYRKYP